MCQQGSKSYGKSEAWSVPKDSDLENDDPSLRKKPIESSESLNQSYTIRK